MEQAISTAEAFESYSAAVIYQLTGETQVPLTTGTSCDFIVLDRNPLEVSTAGLRHIKVLATFKAGQRIA
jgi:predicted amidohydrolase YtcJ